MKTAPLPEIETPFEVPAATSLQERRPRTLKHKNSFALFDHNGDVLCMNGEPDGLYHRDTRHLSKFYMSINGVRPMLLSSGLREGDNALVCDLSNPDFYDAHGNKILSHDKIHIQRVCVLHEATVHERVAVRNFSGQRVRVRVSFDFDADFVDIFEVRGEKRAKRGFTHAPDVGADHVVMRYTGLDDVTRRTRIGFDPKPEKIAAGRAVFEFDLAPRESKAIFICIDCNPEQEEAPPRGFFKALRDAHRENKALHAGGANITSSNEVFNEVMRRSVSDLYLLTTQTPEGMCPYAGIPWFSTVFGRDSIITAMSCLWFDPSIALGVLRHLAANQATRVDHSADSQPGKILHEVRYGEMAELGEVPFRRYYGSVDSTPLFLMLAGEYLERTNDLAAIEALWPNLEAALKWLDDYGDTDGDGFLEYQRAKESGLGNQGWKDSEDSVSHRNGALAKGPIALVEVQAYMYAAWRAAAMIARRLSKVALSENLERRATDLQTLFDRSFFDEDLRSYALALDGAKAPCLVRSSNAGHALFAGIALPERAPMVAETLMRSFSGFGVRTLASSEARYNPISYHNGSVWPHDNAMIAHGFARYGLKREAAQIFQGLFDAATHADLRRLPELMCGFLRRRDSGPVFYPVACAPQAWAAAAPLLMIQSCLGLRIHAAQRQIFLDQPILPDFLDDVTIRDIRVGECGVDISVRRVEGKCVVNVLERRGVCAVSTNI